MRKLITAAVLASFAMGCEPEAPSAPEPPGTLEYEHPDARLYRLGRRIDIIEVRDGVEHRDCGMLSERAYTELEDTLSSLDPSVDHGHDPNDQECSPGAFIHIEGFEHSPFACHALCCGTKLARAALIYSLVEVYFAYGGPLELDGEPYVAIEPDEPCP